MSLYNNVQCTCTCTCTGWLSFLTTRPMWYMAVRSQGSCGSLIKSCVSHCSAMPSKTLLAACLSLIFSTSMERHSCPSQSCNISTDIISCSCDLRVMYMWHSCLFACRPMCERRKILEQNITEVRNRIHLGEQTLIKVHTLYSKLRFAVWVQILEAYKFLQVT